MNLWSAWEFDPGVVVPLAIFATLYALGSQRHFGLTRFQKTCFWTGWASLILALVSPLHPLGEELFSAHMTQHEILMLVSAPLLVLSRPLVTFLWALPIGWRRGLGRWSKTAYVSKTWLLLNGGIHRVVDTCPRDLGMARPLFVRPDAQKRSRPHRPTFELLPLRAPVLVGAALFAWPPLARYRGSLRIHNRHSHGNTRRAANLFATYLVCALRYDHASVGSHAARRPTTRRTDHVGSGKSGLSRRRTFPLCELAERKRYSARKEFRCDVNR